jgi:hypothetical protein
MNTYGGVGSAVATVAPRINPSGDHSTASTAATNPSRGSSISLTRSAITPIRLSARATLSSTRLHAVRLPSRADFCSPGELSILMVAMTTPVVWEVARRVEVASVGVRLPARKLTPDRLRTAVRDAINLRPGAQGIAAAFAAAGGPIAAAEALETLARTRAQT